MWSNPATYGAIFSGITVLIAIIVLYKSIKGESRDQGKWEGQVEEFMKKVEQFMAEVREDIKEVRLDIRDLFARSSPSKTVESKSPRTLTDLGKDISKELEVSTWAKEQSLQTLSDVQDKENFEIEAFAFAYVGNETISSETFKRKIQRCAYERGLADTEIQAVFAIELRDALLAMSGNISV